MKTAISIPDKLFRSAERLAKELGIPRSTLYSNALALFVTQEQKRDLTALLNDVYAHETSALDPTLAALQAQALPADEW